jgi:HK97 family phage major capsid protein
MKDNIITLKRERAVALRGMRDLHEKAATEKRAKSNDERAEFDRLDDVQIALTGRIDAIESGRNPNARGIDGGSLTHRTTVGAEEVIYRMDAGAPKDSPNFLDDLYAEKRGDTAARERLMANTRRAAEIEKRAGLTAFTATAGAEFAGPVLQTGIALTPRTYGHNYLAALGTSPIVLGAGGVMYVPNATTASSVAETAEDGSVTFQDWVSAVIELDIATLAGGVTLSQQFRDLAPAAANASIASDLTNKYEMAQELYSVTSTTSNVKGLEAISGVNSVVTTGTDLSLLWKAVVQAKIQLAGSGAYCQAEFIAINPEMLGNLIGDLPASGGDLRPQLSFPESTAANPMGHWNGQTIGHVGSLAGTPLVSTPAISAATGGDESRIYVVNGLGHSVFTSPMRVKLADQVGVATLTPRVVAWGYAAQFSPFPKAISVVSGEAVEAIDLSA